MKNSTNFPKVLILFCSLKCNIKVEYYIEKISEHTGKFWSYAYQDC